MGNDDGPGFFRQTTPEIANINIEGLPVDVGRDGDGPDGADRVEQGRTDEAGDDDLVALADAQRRQRQLKGGRAGADRRGIADADLCRQSLFEGGHPLPLGDPPGSQHGQRRGGFFLPECRAGVRDHRPP